MRCGRVGEGAANILKRAGLAPVVSCQVPRRNNDAEVIRKLEKLDLRMHGAVGAHGRKTKPDVAGRHVGPHLIFLCSRSAMTFIIVRGRYSPYVCLVACVCHADEPRPGNVNSGQQPAIIPLVRREDSELELVFLEHLLRFDVVPSPFAPISPRPFDGTLSERE